MELGMQPSSTDPKKLSERIAEASCWVGSVKEEISRVLVGQEELVDRLLIGLLCNGHILLEGMPGLAKTLSVKALAGTLQLSFSRLQFTPDLLPADLVGTMIYNPDRRDFSAKLGPVFANIILADEINRAPAKVQSALLEAMQERQVTLGETSHPLPCPFLVLATQNPIDQEGTYNLPEAQADRFMFKVVMPASDRAIIRKIVDKVSTVAVVAPGEGQGVGYLPKSPDESRRQYEELKQQIKAVTLPPAIYTHIENLFL